MKPSILNILGFLAFIITVAIIIGSFMYIKDDLRIGFGNDNAERSWNGQKTPQEEGTESFSSIDALELSTVAGAIEIEYWDNPNVEITWKKWGTPSVIEKLEIEITQQGSKLSAKVQHPRGISGFNGWASFTVKIPATLEDLEAGSVSGSIKVLGPEEQLTSIDQDLHTVSGSVYTDGAADLKLKSVSGSLKFRTAGSRVECSTTSGSIKGSILNEESNDIDLSSVSGSITIGIKDDWQGEVSMRSVSGSMKSSIPLLVENQSRSRLEGMIGDGEGEMELSTTSGSIRIEEGDVL